MPAPTLVGVTLTLRFESGMPTRTDGGGVTSLSVPAAVERCCVGQSCTPVTDGAVAPGPAAASVSPYVIVMVSPPASVTP